MIAANPLSPLEDILRHALNWLHGTIGLPWAWSIVALTVIVRMLLVPLTVKQIHSMQALQRHMPEMKEIQRKYKGDRQKQNEEMMRFYRENSINPAASCLPMLAQLPVFFSLYFVLRKFSNHPPGGLGAVARGEFSWLHVVPNIADHINAHWSGYLLLVVYALSQISSTFFMGATMERSQRIMFMILPVAFIPFLLRFPTGLLLYWMTTNLWTVGQGLITRRLVPKTAGISLPKRSSRTPPSGKEEPASALAAKAAAAPAKGTPAATTAARRVKRKKKSRR